MIPFWSPKNEKKPLGGQGFMGGALQNMFYNNTTYYIPTITNLSQNLCGSCPQEGSLLMSKTSFVHLVFLWIGWRDFP